MHKNMFAFPDKDVYVAVPKYHRIGPLRYPIIVIDKGINIPQPPTMRIMINFEIRYVDNGVEHLLTEIRPFFEMWLGYNSTEEYHNLLVYDPTNRAMPIPRRWVPLGHVKSHSPHATPSLGNMIGYGYAKESEWGDPNLGWG